MCTLYKMEKDNTPTKRGAMLSFARRALNFEPERDIFISVTDNRNLQNLSVGLRLILDRHISHADSSSVDPNSAAGTVLRKSYNASISPAANSSSPIGKESEFGGFLNSCYLCRRRLSPDADVYMYMGDKGFCSEVCRTKQIGMDERKEAEDSIDRRLMLSGSDQADCPNGGDCETCRLLKDLRHRRRRRKLLRARR